MSPAAQASSGVTMTCLKGRLDEPLSHDNLFHSVLGLMDVTTALYQRPLDFFSACVGADKATAVR
jgi:lipid A ethanolaminephosphotransferase